MANSPYTVLGESMSAGRLYDKIEKTASAKVVMVTEAGVLCKVCRKSLIENRTQKGENSYAEGSESEVQTVQARTDYA